MKKSRGELRGAIIDAARKLLESSNLSELTLDAVAAKAGISKGGLQYHFSSKNDLLTAMVARLVEDFENEWRLDDAENASPDQLLEAYLNRSFGLGAATNHASWHLWSDAAQRKTLLEPIRENWKVRTTELLANSPNPHVAMILSLAADALWHYDSLGMVRFAPELRKQLHVTILDLARREGLLPAAIKKASRKPAIRPPIKTTKAPRKK